MASDLPAAPLPRARKRFGQHFLHDPAIVRRIVNCVAVDQGETVVEIGPGRGALTGLLASCGEAACKLPLHIPLLFTMSPL